MMTRTYLHAAVASAALVIAMPAIAGPGGGRGGARGGAEADAAVNPRAEMMREMRETRAQARDAARLDNITRGNAGANVDASIHDNARLNPQAFDRASVNAITRANERSALGRGAVPSASLPGVTVGANIQNSTGSSIGTVSQVLTTRTGAVAGVEVTTSSGETIRLPASALNTAGGNISVNVGEALGAGLVPRDALPGLTTGLSVQTNTGSAFGTVNKIETTGNGRIRDVIVTGTDGQTYRLPAAAVSISGNVLTVNTAALNGKASANSAVNANTTASVGNTAVNAASSVNLPGLTTGLSVQTSTGVNLGTVTSIRMVGNGSVKTVVVTDANGQTYTIPASALSINGNVVTVNTAALTQGANNSQAFQHASPTAFEHANSHSALFRGAVPTAALPGLATGLAVQSITGDTVGTVTQILGRNGLVTGVVVTDANGQTIRIPASALSINGSIVTVDSAALANIGAGGNVNTGGNVGLGGHGGVPGVQLPGLTTGLTVVSSTGATVGTISNIIMDDGRIKAVIVTDANGQTIRLPASALTINGTAVTVNAAVLANNDRDDDEDGDELGDNDGGGISLPGLTTGLTVTSSTGVNLGTVTRIITDHGRIEAVLVTDANGQILRVPASALSISGSVVMVNTAVLANNDGDDDDLNGDDNDDDQGEDEG